ncbi:MAG: T9SS type A sorting domain-containing protein [Bacteroidetes bacterium]|nr:T9SS type A sorting domain-containing protein [Bacteroidota bacterium]
MNIRIQNIVQGYKSTRIYNLLGSDFFSMALSPNQHNYSVNTSSWPAGIYFVEIITEEGRSKR